MTSNTKKTSKKKAFDSSKRTDNVSPSVKALEPIRPLAFCTTHKGKPH